MGARAGESRARFSRFSLFFLDLSLSPLPPPSLLQFFKEFVIGCFVKLNIGTPPGESKTYYRLCQVVGVEDTEKVYSFPMDTRKQGRQVKTTLKLKLKFGVQESLFSMGKVTNEAFVQQDFTLWQKNMKDNRLDLLSGRACLKLSRSKAKLLKHSYTHEDVAAQIATRKKLAPGRVVNIALEIDRVKDAILREETEGEEKRGVIERVKEANPNLVITDADTNADNLPDEDEEPLLAAARKETVDAMRALENAETRLSALRGELANVERQDAQRLRAKATNKKVSGMEKVNDRNKMENKSSDFNSYKEQLQAEEDKKRKGETYNPYARRPNKPKVLWDVGMGDGDVKENVGAPKAADKEDKESAQPSAASAAASVAPSVASPPAAGGSVDAHQFNLDSADIALERAHRSLAVTAAKKAQADAALEAQGGAAVRERQGMSFKDYMAKKKRDKGQ